MSKTRIQPEDRFGELIAIKFSRSDHRGKTRWIFKCDCGIEKEILVSNVVRGLTKTCGCGVIKAARMIGERTKKEYGVASFNNLYLRYKTKSKNKGYIFDLSIEEFKNITSRNCFYCGIPPSQTGNKNHKHGYYTYNGIDRIDSSKGYTIDNSVPCCFTCNRAKGNLSIKEFEEWIKRLYLNMDL